MPLRKAGAGPLAPCWSQQLHVDGTCARGACSTEKSAVFHSATGRKLPYASLVVEASEIASPKDTPVKSPNDFRIIGQWLKRLDTPEKVNGKALYSIDAMPAGVKFATLAQSPVFGGSVARIDDRKAKQILRRPPGAGVRRFRRRRRRQHVGREEGPRRRRHYVG